MRIQKAVKGLCTLGQLCQVPVLQRLREGVKQAPHVPPLKRIMTGLAPFIEHRRDQSVRAHSDVCGPDNQIMSFDVSDLGFLVLGDPGVLIMPFREEEADGTFNQLRQIPDNEPGVLSGEFDLTRKAQIITNKYRGTSDNACGEGLVVAISKTQNPTVVFTGFLAVDFHQTKVALAFMGKRVCLGADGEPGGFEGFLDRVDELEMRDRAPAFSGGRRFDFADFIKVHMGSSAVKREVGSPAGGDNG